MMTEKHSKPTGADRIAADSASTANFHQLMAKRAAATAASASKAPTDAAQKPESATKTPAKQA
jgi:hypothetical protein